MKLTATIQVEVIIKSDDELEDAQGRAIERLLQTCDEWTKGELVPVIKFSFEQDSEDIEDLLNLVN